MDNISKGYVSADGHVVEPADLWTTRMDKRFRERAPRVEARDDADYYIIDGLTPFPVGLEGASMEDKLAGNIETSASRHADTRPGAWDPQQRLGDQDMDHVRAEVIYAGAFGLQFYTVKDAEYQRHAERTKCQHRAIGNRRQHQEIEHPEKSIYQVRDVSHIDHPPRKLRRTSGFASNAAPVSV